MYVYLKQKLEKYLYPERYILLLYKDGFKGEFIAWTCNPDGSPIALFVLAVLLSLLTLVVVVVVVVVLLLVVIVVEIVIVVVV